MKILVIFTGGTIGSSVKGDYIDTDNNKKYMLLDRYKCRGEKPLFDTLEPYTILSENLIGENINILAGCIEQNQSAYDGIIVTHGTDTLQYTAAGLALMLPELKLPVVLVSSNYILEDERANGMNNFNAAVAFISYAANKQEHAGIFVAYNNGGDKTCIHYGSMLMPHAAYDDKLYSIDGVHAGWVLDERFIPDETADKAAITKCINKAREIIKKTAINKNAAAKAKYQDYSNVLWLHEHPGFLYSTVADNIKCVLLETYHSGTLCSMNQTLMEFIKDCNEMSIPVFVVGVEDRTQYESTRFFEGSRLNVLPKLSPVLAYMLLWLENK